MWKDHTVRPGAWLLESSSPRHVREKAFEMSPHAVIWLPWHEIQIPQLKATLMSSDTSEP